MASETVYMTQQNRTIAFLFSIMILVILGLTITINQMLPLQQTKVKFVQVLGSGEIGMQVQTASIDDANFREVAIKGSLRSYVVNRESVDEFAQKSFYECVYNMSSDSIAEEFKKHIVDNPKSNWNSKRFKRVVKILNDAVLSEEENVMQYFLHYKDTSKFFKKPVEGELVVTLKYSLRDVSVTEEELLLGSENTYICNLGGVQIENYSVQKRR